MYNLIILLYSLIMLPFYFVAGESSAISLSLINSPFPSANFNIEDFLFSPIDNTPAESVDFLSPITQLSPECGCTATSHAHHVIEHLTLRVNVLEHELFELSRKVSCLTKEATTDKAALHREITHLKQQRKRDRAVFQEYFASLKKLLEHFNREIADIHHEDPSVVSNEHIDIEPCSSDDESSKRNSLKRHRND
jgi:hypothetical protein